MIQDYVAGEYVKSSATETVEVINPANGQVLDKCPLGGKADVDRAVLAAAEAFKTWRKTPAIERIQPFFKLKTLMEENFEHLAASVTREHGKTLVEAKGSVRRAIQMVETATGMPSMMLGETSEDIAPGIDSHMVRRPMGVFSAIVPFNFPAMVPFWFWPFGVAAGNTFVIKPSERVPLTQTEMTKLIEKAGFPKGVVNVVHGGKDTVNAICEHPDIQGVSFVGSTPVAKHVYKTCAAAGKRVQSLGGAKNFMVVLPDAKLDKAASVSFDSITGCAGERCLAGSVVIGVGETVYSEMKNRLTLIAKDVIVGDGMDKNTQMGPVISQESKERILKLIQSAVDEGAEVLVDGRINADKINGGRGYFLNPTVIAGVKPHMKIAREEIFGPVVLVAKTESFDEAIEWLNSSEYANTATLFTESGAHARKFSYEAAPSMIGVNIGVPAPMSFFSFGGSKASFFGDVKAHGRGCVNFFCDSVVTIQRWHSDAEIWAQK